MRQVLFTLLASSGGRAGKLTDCHGQPGGREVECLVQGESLLGMTVQKMQPKMSYSAPFHFPLCRLCIGLLDQRLA